MKLTAFLKQICGVNFYKFYELSGLQVFIGRSPDCKIHISSPSISCRHCVLTRKKDDWTVKDYMSRNGTYINGRRLKPDQEYLLQIGDILFFGPPSELPPAFLYNKLIEIENDSEDDILELPQKRASEGNIEISSKKTSLSIPSSSNYETLKRQSSPNAFAVISDSPVKYEPSARKRRHPQILSMICGVNCYKFYELSGLQVLIGRSPDCKIHISSPSISCRHCVLTRKKDDWTVKDHMSRNGTYINERRLKPDQEYLLQIGDILCLGPPSELPPIFFYNEFIENENDSDDDILEFPQKRASEENIEISSKKTSLSIPSSSNYETLKRQSSPSAFAIMSDSPVKYEPPARKKRHPQIRIELTPSISGNPADNSNVSDSCASIASSSKSKNNSIDMDINYMEQFYESSNTNNDDNSESFIPIDLQDSQEDNIEVFKNGSDAKVEKEKKLELKLALLAEEVKNLQASKLELLKNYKNVCEENKVLDKELIDKQKKMEKELQMQEVKAKNEVKSELLEKFEEDLVCNICTELFIKPTVLDCSHTFCEFCIKEWRKKKNICPICRCKIENTTQVRTLEQFIDKTLATLTPNQKLKRANVIAERNLAERPPPPSVPSGSRLTPRRRRGSYRHHNRHHGTNTNNPVNGRNQDLSESINNPVNGSNEVLHASHNNPANSSTEVLDESGRFHYHSHTIYRLAPGRTGRPLNIVNRTTISVNFI